MQIRAIQWDFDAWEDYLYWQGQDKKTLKRVNQLVKDRSRHAGGKRYYEMLIMHKKPAYFLYTYTD